MDTICYDQVYVGENEQEAEQLNLLRPSKSLEVAKRNGKDFVLISSPLLFDRTIEMVYTESSIPTCHLPWATFLRKMEEKVLEYDKGYVFRLQDPVNDLRPYFRLIASFGDHLVVPCGAVSPLSVQAFSFLKKRCLNDRIRFAHFALKAIFQWVELAFALRNEKPFLSDTKGNIELPVYRGFLQSDVLIKWDLYGGMERENKNIIIDEIHSIAENNDVQEE